MNQLPPSAPRFISHAGTGRSREGDHLGPVKQVYSDPATMFDTFPFDGRGGRVAAKLISFYNRRLTVLARKRIAAGVYGKRNAGWRLLIPGFTPDPKVSGRLLFSGIGRWLKMELGALWLRGGESPMHEVRPESVPPAA